MEVFSERRLAKDHADRIRKGYSAYAETDTLASLIKKELQICNLRVYEDLTDFGCWFIPVTDEH
ncbi:hypothetical protein QRX25_13645 [Bacillus sp. L381]|uniref:hypothetical protein n=1 Tax=Bacillus TaxID=1386 RepID=UPI00066FC198|nr:MULTISPECIES: hypothetical protein [Bacillus]AOC92058.1 uncharacterized protein BARD7_02593 [Bacillus amyloliquefaciens]MCR9039160.1 hypothetical protein [Bacillus velezensis]QUN08559.1 hypothetical protein KEF49_13470 [Bacillus amyloliquefaciens]QYM81631.1 hypothetical protein KTJ85_13325 [Bacillus sp. 7D3]QZY10779.1 hypothetical protein K7B13_13565 [Bacillus amyloliquefaciens]